MKRVLVLLLPLLLCGCAAEEINGQEKTAWYDTVESCPITDADLDVTQNNPKEIGFEGNQQAYVIDSAGDYIISGKCDGQIQIDVQDRIAHLILDNAELQSRNGPAIYVKSAAKVVITIPEGTTCIIKDSPDYDGWEKARACIFSEDDLTINGGGTLQVYGYCNDAIRTKDVLKILDVNLDMTTKGTGLRGNDGVLIQNANLSIQCEEIGIYTEKENKETLGFVDISGGTVNIIAGEYGISVAQNLYIRECRADVFGVIQDVLCSGEKYIEEGCLE